MNVVVSMAEKAYDVDEQEVQIGNSGLTASKLRFHGVRFAP